MMINELTLHVSMHSCIMYDYCILMACDYIVFITLNLMREYWSFPCEDTNRIVIPGRKVWFGTGILCWMRLDVSFTIPLNSIDEIIFILASCRSLIHISDWIRRLRIPHFDYLFLKILKSNTIFTATTKSLKRFLFAEVQEMVEASKVKFLTLNLN